MEEQKLGIKEQERLTVGDGFIGMLNAFVDPAGLAKRVPAPLSWLWPVISLTIIYLVFSYLMLPYTMNLVDLRINQQIRVTIYLTKRSSWPIMNHGQRTKDTPRGNPLFLRSYQLP